MVKELALAGYYLYLWTLDSDLIDFVLGSARTSSRGFWLEFSTLRLFGPFFTSRVRIH